MAPARARACRGLQAVRRNAKCASLRTDPATTAHLMRTAPRSVVGVVAGNAGYGGVANDVVTSLKVKNVHQVSKALLEQGIDAWLTVRARVAAPPTVR